MRINKKLNLVIELSDISVHHESISSDIFKQNFLLIAKTHDAIYDEGISKSGSQVALYLLESIAKDSGINPNPLLNELVRTTNVIINNGYAYQHLPLDEAVKDGHLSIDDRDLIVSSVVFFTLIVCIQRGKMIQSASLDAMNQIWQLQSTSLDCMELMKSLETSKADGAF